MFKINTECSNNLFFVPVAYDASINMMKFFSTTVLLLSKHSHRAWICFTKTSLVAKLKWINRVRENMAAAVRWALQYFIWETLAPRAVVLAGKTHV